MKSKIKVGDEVWIYDGPCAPRKGTVTSEGPIDMEDTWYVRDGYGNRLYSGHSIRSSAESAANDVRDTIDLLERWLKNNDQ